jgi:hypothetical protein
MNSEVCIIMGNFYLTAESTEEENERPNRLVP